MHCFHDGGSLARQALPSRHLSMSKDRSPQQENNSSFEHHIVPRVKSTSVHHTKFLEMAQVLKLTSSSSVRRMFCRQAFHLQAAQCARNLMHSTVIFFRGTPIVRWDGGQLLLHDRHHGRLCYTPWQPRVIYRHITQETECSFRGPLVQSGSWESSSWGLWADTEETGSCSVWSRRGLLFWVAYSLFACTRSEHADTFFSSPGWLLTSPFPPSMLLHCGVPFFHSRFASMRHCPIFAEHGSHWVLWMVRRKLWLDHVWWQLQVTVACR